MGKGVEKQPHTLSEEVQIGIIFFYTKTDNTD